jgi:hypothetical protein
LELVLEVERDQEALVVTLEVGDHFIVVAKEGNDEGFEFWILVCVEPLHLLKKSIKLIARVKWCFKGNILSLEGITNNKAIVQHHMCCVMEALHSFILT